VRFAPGGIRKGAAGFDITFLHPKANEQFPIAGEGVLIELVQAPPTSSQAFARLPDLGRPYPVATTSIRRPKESRRRRDGEYRIESRPMRRALLIFLMWLVPFQSVWSAGHAMHEHLVATAYSHDHDHNHDHGDRDFFDLVDNPFGAHDEDGHHGCHSHPGFSFLVTDTGQSPDDTRREQPPQAPPASFTSHIPLLPDPPPAVRI
jgi:hypothetical protein